MKHTVTHYQFNIKKSGINPGSLKLMFLSDMHGKLWGEKGAEVFDILEREKPDLLLSGGDMLVGKKDYDFSATVDFLKALSEKQTIYYALGNHEHRIRNTEKYGNMYQDYMTALKDADIVFLDNATQKLSINQLPIDLSGLTIDKHYYRKKLGITMPEDYVTSLLGTPNQEHINILLAHHPRYLDSYFKWKSDLILCGHYHGGVVGLGKHRGLIAPDLRPFPAYARGLFIRDNQAAIVSAGMGDHTVPRFFNDTEIIIIDLSVNN